MRKPLPCPAGSQTSSPLPGGVRLPYASDTNSPKPTFGKCTLPPNQTKPDYVSDLESSSTRRPSLPAKQKKHNLNTGVSGNNRMAIYMTPRPIHSKPSVDRQQSAPSKFSTLPVPGLPFPRLKVNKLNDAENKDPEFRRFHDVENKDQELGRLHESWKNKKRGCRAVPLPPPPVPPQTQSSCDRFSKDSNAIETSSSPACPSRKYRQLPVPRESSDSPPAKPPSLSEVNLDRFKMTSSQNRNSAPRISIRSVASEQPEPRITGSSSDEDDYLSMNMSPMVSPMSQYYDTDEDLYEYAPYQFN